MRGIFKLHMGEVAYLSHHAVVVIVAVVIVIGMDVISEQFELTTPYPLANSAQLH